MQRCDVLVVGGGPAGSTCAAALVREGLDVVIVDKAVFPRDKVCAGWITPAVVDELDLDLDDYSRDRTLDAVLGFRVGRMGDRTHLHRYDRPVSYGIRRCEFDQYLLLRSGACLALGEPVERFERRGPGWIVDERFEASLLVGAGGHFCPVARAMQRRPDAAVVAAEETEFELDTSGLGDSAVEAGVPELYFTQDLSGYGWVFRKGKVLNIGLGVRSGSRGAAGAPPLRRRVGDFVDFLVREGRIARAPRVKMKGHAYLLQPDSRRSRAGDGYLLVGDSAGLAYDRSGEGIRCAIESALLAAPVLRDAFRSGRCGQEVLRRYEAALERRFGAAATSDLASALPLRLRRPLAAALMASAWFSRRVLLERWFLHAHEPALAPMA